MKFSKLIVVTTLFVVMFFTSAFPVAAIDCSDVTTGEPPHFVCIINPIFKIANVGIMMGGVVFAIMIGVGAIKLATSLGDPKGLEGASKTWTYALVGVAIVLGAVTIMSLIGSVFGLPIDPRSNGGLFARAQAAILDFLDKITIIE